MTYVAPARFVLTELHVPEDPADLAAACLEPVTRCGLPMEQDENWMPVELRPGDKVCPACSGTAESGTEEGLW